MIKKNRKITRNSYKRKVILFGVILFMSIALISTGFAAWVMSSGDKEESSGGVDVGIVADTNLTISDFKIFKEEIDEEGKVKEVEVKINEFTFNFDPLASDTTGRVRSKEGDPTESMVMIVKGFISPKEFLSNVTIKLEVSQGIIDAANQGYITLPECATLVGNNVFVTLKEGDTALLAETKLNDREETVPTGRVILNYRIAFGWGEKFGGMNPGLYYDSHQVGILESDDVAKESLEKLRAVIYGYTYNPEATDEELKAYQGPTYKLTISANIN